MKWVIELFTAGLARIFLHYGIVGLIVGLCIAGEFIAAYFSTWPFIGPLCVKLQRDLLWVGVIAAFGALMMWVGGHDMEKRWMAKETVIERQVHSVVTKSKEPTNKLNGDTND